MNRSTLGLGGEYVEQEHSRVGRVGRGSWTGALYGWEGWEGSTLNRSTLGLGGLGGGVGQEHSRVGRGS